MQNQVFYSLFQIFLKPIFRECEACPPVAVVWSMNVHLFESFSTKFEVNNVCNILPVSQTKESQKEPGRPITVSTGGRRRITPRYFATELSMFHLVPTLPRPDAKSTQTTIWFSTWTFSSAKPLMRLQSSWSPRWTNQQRVLHCETDNVLIDANF